MVSKRFGGSEEVAAALAEGVVSKMEQRGPSRVFIYGPSGIGKTTMLSRIQTAWEARGWSAWAKDCASNQPNTTWSSGDVPTSSDWLVQFHFLMTGARSGPRLVLIDDLQFADSSTFRLLTELAKSGSERIALVVSYRDDVSFSLPEEFASFALLVPDSTRLAVPPLGWSETRSLLSGLVPPAMEPGIELTDRLFSLTGGNPLYVEHAAHALRTGHDPFGDDAGLLGLLARRISALGPEAQELLSTAAAVGDRFAVWLVASVESRSEADVWRLMRAAVHSGIIRETDSELELAFAHPAIREAASRFRLRHERVLLHRELLQRFELSGDDTDPLVLAQHAELAGDWAGYRKYSEAAAEAANDRRDFRRAADHLDRAVAAARLSSGRADEPLIRKAALAWVAAGRGARAAELWEELAERRFVEGDPRGEAESYAQAVRAEFSETRLERLYEAIPRARALGPSAALATALASAVHATAGGRMVGGRSVLGASEEALTMAREVSDDEPLAIALLARGHIVANSVDFEAGIAFLRECLEVAQRSGARREEHAALVNLVLLLTKSGDWQNARSQAESAATSATWRGAFRLAGQFHAKVADILRMTGDLEGAARTAAEATLMTDKEDLQSFQVSHLARAAVAADRGQWLTVDVELDTILSEPGTARDSWFPGANVSYMRARSHLATGRVADAWVEAKRVHHLWLKSGDAYYASRFLEPYIALLCSTAQLENATEVVAELTRRLRWLPAEIRRTTQPWVDAFVARLALGRGELERALSLESNCQDAWVVLGEPYPLARSRFRLADILLKRAQPGDRPRAKLLLATAQQTLESLGAPEAASVRSLRRREKWLRDTRASDSGRLTTREREIAELVAAGHSNQAIATVLTLSPRTVENHIARIYSKTGVNSRVQLSTLPSLRAK